MTIEHRSRSALADHYCPEIRVGLFQMYNPPHQRLLEIPLSFRWRLEQDPLRRGGNTVLIRIIANLNASITSVDKEVCTINRCGSKHFLYKDRRPLR